MNKYAWYNEDKKAFLANPTISKIKVMKVCFVLSLIVLMPLAASLISEYSR